MRRLVLATRNEHKLREFRELLPDDEVIALPEGVGMPPEAGESFAENALAKARTAHRATGQAAIADDSGIEAVALGGLPGARSARFAGPDASDRDNLELLMDRLRGEGDRGVAYVCALAFRDSAREFVLEARCEGELADSPRGEGGFGYDPAFIPADTGPQDPRTMAELSDREKNAISHRGRAARMLLDRLALVGEDDPEGAPAGSEGPW
jgi:XTP/dITP diphosphohydrolase